MTVKPKVGATVVAPAAAVALAVHTALDQPYMMLQKSSSHPTCGPCQWWLQAARLVQAGSTGVAAAAVVAAMCCCRSGQPSQNHCKKADTPLTNTLRVLCASLPGVRLHLI